MRTRFPQFIILLVALVAMHASAQEQVFAKDPKIPEGWTREFYPWVECSVGISNEPLVLRNKEGTTWIFSFTDSGEYSKDRDTSLREINNSIESNEVSGIPYVVFTPKDVEKLGDNSVSIWFPTYRTIFSCRFSSEGKTSYVNAERWWVSPATKEQTEREFIEAKKAVLEVVSEFVRSSQKPSKE